MNIKLILVAALLGLNIGSTVVWAGEGGSDWRQNYKLMVGAYYTSDYDEAIREAQTCLDKVLRLTDQTERNVALDELIKYLNMLSGRNGRQQNYAQQELVLKCKLKATEARYADDSASDYRSTQIKKDLATCLVLEGKSKEAEEYLSKTGKVRNSENLSGWKKDLDLLTEANRGRRANNNVDSDTLCQYAANAVKDALSVKNATEKEVAFSQILQQLQMAQYKFRDRNKDYANEEKILKLILKIQQTQELEQSTDNIYGIGNYQSSSTLKELVTCLVMEGKNDEAATYDAQYKEMTEKSTKKMRKFQKDLQDQLLKNQQPKDKE